MISRVRAALSRQLSHPSGPGGRVVARLEIQSGNRQAGFGEAEVETPRGGKTHLVVASR